MEDKAEGMRVQQKEETGQKMRRKDEIRGEEQGGNRE